ncbi:unnamed protein product [Lathyrus sativus]|nr:unnamed protein product [Lathyrus sativus]
MGGRVILINSVLANLPIHYLAFFKAPNKVVKDFIAVQRRFLWAGNSSESFIPWVSWNSVCKPKEDGGLGIKHVGRLNSALLAKWIWRFQTGENEIWRNTLTNRYGNLNIKSQTYSEVDSSRSNSLWMKDIMANASLNSHANFCNFMACSVGEGYDAAFWKSIWIGDMPLKVRFNGLFQNCSMKTMSVRDMGYWENGKWIWKLRDLLADPDFHPEPKWSECCRLLDNISVTPGESEKWRWTAHDSLSFKVSSFYSVLYSSLPEQAIGSNCASLIESI